MGGIMIKDLYECFCIKKNALNWILGILVGLMITILLPSEYVFILNVAITFPIMGTSALQFTVEQDEISNFDKVQLTFPLTKQEIVASKYLVGLLVEVGAFIFSFLMMLAYVYGFKLITLTAAFPIWVMGIIISLLFFALCYIGYFWLGNKKGTILYFIFVVLVAVAYVLTTMNIGVSSFLQFDQTVLLVVGLIISFVAVYLSYLVSLRIYIKKHL